MKRANDELGVTFAMPDAPTVRQQLRYWSVVMTSSDRAEMYERYWRGAREMITSWDCDHVALDADLDEVNDTRAAQAIMWAGLEVFKAISAFEDVPKNS